MITDLYLDVDGVFADFVRGVRGSLNLPHNWEPKIWDIELDPEITHRVKEYNEIIRKEKFCLSLHEYSDSFRQFYRLKNSGLYRIKFLTSPMTECTTWETERAQWLDQRFPHTPIIFEKNKFIYANKNAILVDDSSLHTEQWIKNNGTAFLVKRSYNQGTQTLEEIVNTLL